MRLRSRTCLALLLASLLASLLAGCGAIDHSAPASSVESGRTPVPRVDLTPTPTATPLPLAIGQPIPVVVRQVIVAMTASDLEALTALTTYQQLPCTTALGSGGPPKCRPADAPGTVYTVFATGGCEGEWSLDTRATLAQLTRQPTILTAAAQLEIPANDPEPYWPKGWYVVVFTAASGSAQGGPPGIYFILDRTRIVRAHAICGAGTGGVSTLLQQLRASSLLIAPP
ncbi:MAG: hypothetical protein EXR68_04725 [Dehalococcoidia bacterium]|nr:hypothetical protein [Dehalococcoidia bacterium]